MAAKAIAKKKGFDSRMGNFPSTLTESVQDLGKMVPIQMF